MKGLSRETDHIYMYIERCMYIGPYILNVQKGNVQRFLARGKYLALVLG